MDPASVGAIAVIVVATAYAIVRKALFSLTYAVAVLAVYVLEAATSFQGNVATSPVPFELGLTAGPGVVPTPWTWVTFEFVHASETHVFLNLLGLVFISPTFEERVGSARWAVLFFAGGAFGAIVFLAVHLGQVVLLVGASAGISAVFGAYGRLYPNDRVTLFLPIPGLPTVRVAELVVGFLVLEMVLGLVGPRGIAWEAHAGAIAFGFAVAPAAMRLPIPEGKGHTARPARVDRLRDLAMTPELRGFLDQWEQADLPETRAAWMEKFIAAAPCPRCGGPLRRRLGWLTSPCGWRRAI